MYVYIMHMHNIIYMYACIASISFRTAWLVECFLVVGSNFVDISLRLILSCHNSTTGSLHVHNLGKLVEFSDTPTHLLPDEYR